MGFGGSGGGGGSIGTSSDVALNSLANGQLLGYDSSLQKWKNVTGQNSTLELESALTGSVFRCQWNGTAWTYSGTALSARPSSRTDIYFDLVGAPASTSDPSWIIPGDSRMDI